MGNLTGDKAVHIVWHVSVPVPAKPLNIRKIQRVNPGITIQGISNYKAYSDALYRKH
jgi:hypothetical protein